MVIKVRLDGKWNKKAKYEATYTIYTKCQIGDKVSRAPYFESKEAVIENKKSAKKLDAVIMLMPAKQIQKKGQSQRLQASSLNENSNIAIMLKDVEGELTTVKLKLSFNPNSMRIVDVNVPIFENDEIKAHFQQKEINNQSGKIEITVVITDEGTKSTGADKIISSEEEAIEEEENIAPIAYLIMDTTGITQKAKSLSNSKTVDIYNWISMDDVELKDTDGQLMRVKVGDKIITKIQPESTLEAAYCYPNPTKEGWVTFVKLTERVRVSIFNISGELVYEGEYTTNGEWTWQCINNDSEKLASGVYIYLLIDSQTGEQKRGKLSIIK